MTLFPAADLAFARAVSRIAYANPFLPERIALEREALGREFVEAGAVWNVRADLAEDHPNLVRLVDRSGAVSERARERLAGRARASAPETALHEDVVLFYLYHRYREDFYRLIVRPGSAAGRERVAFFRRFREEAGRLLDLPGLDLPERPDVAHLFASFFQLRRAFHHIFQYVVGGSLPAARLRAATWQSIFTHDLRRYRRALHARMQDITTLVTGPSGTGKELVAQAIGLSRYIPFDLASETFAEDFAGSFHPVNLSALAPTLVEAELFGYRRGAFTGAVQDRAGWLEACSPQGTVFLDEIGDLAPEIQVKLLRVLHSRTFQRLGDLEPRRFRGKIVAATNRDLTEEIRAGRFREDLYYRLCADIVTTPSLREQLRDAPGELSNLIRFVARRVAGDSEEEAVAREVEAWTAEHLGPNYPWPGNVRELEQCVRNILVRKEYLPPKPPAARGPRETLSRAAAEGTMTADELLGRYCTLVYSQCGSYEETARRLDLDRRTVKVKVDRNLLEAYHKEKGA